MFFTMRRFILSLTLLFSIMERERAGLYAFVCYFLHAFLSVFILFLFVSGVGCVFVCGIHWTFLLTFLHFITVRFQIIRKTVYAN